MRSPSGSSAVLHFYASILPFYRTAELPDGERNYLLKHVENVKNKLIYNHLQCSINRKINNITLIEQTQRDDDTKNGEYLTF